MAKLVYQPLGLAVSVVGGVLSGLLFKQAWKAIAGEEEAPNATDRNRKWAEVLGAAALQGAIFGLVKAAVDRAGAEGFARTTGVWPGD
jgi:hypothetical protein